MGSLFAAYLSEGGLEVTLVDHRPERVERLSAEGITVKGSRGEHHVRIPVVAEASQVGTAELVIVCVKAYQTAAALQQHLALVGEQTTVWSIQNGLGNVEAMARLLPAARIVGGSTTLGANKLGVGLLHHAGEGDTLIGELDGRVSARVERIAALLTAAGITVRISQEIRRVIWSKLLVNVGINALTAILGVSNGTLLEHEPSLQLMDAAVGEAVRVAAEQGFAFAEHEVQARVREVARRTGQNRSSMLQDVLAGRRTEVEFINGAIARLGAAPVNGTLTRLVLALEAAGPAGRLR